MTQNFLTLVVNYQIRIFLWFLEKLRQEITEELKKLCNLPESSEYSGDLKSGLV